MSGVARNISWNVSDKRLGNFKLKSPCKKNILKLDTANQMLMMTLRAFNLYMLEWIPQSVHGLEKYTYV